MEQYQDETDGGTRVSTPIATGKGRWFHAVFRAIAKNGLWHYGEAERSAAGGLWPVRKAARCGYRQWDPINVGDQETAAAVGTAAANVCPTCLASVKAAYKRT